VTLPLNGLMAVGRQLAKKVVLIVIAILIVQAYGASRAIRKAKETLVFAMRTTTEVKPQIGDPYIATFADAPLRW
jgi:hypothetical protein